MRDMTPKALYLKGMHGMGDNFHQRTFVRRYLAQYDLVYLETSWPSLYWDLVKSGKLKLVFKDSNLRTQEKNAFRELAQFAFKSPGEVPHIPGRVDKQIWYRAKDIREADSVLGAMAVCLEESYGDGDFRFPIKDEWRKQFFQEVLPKLNNTGGKPILVYRPLVERTEWSGCNARNPDHDTFRTLYSSVRERFHVVSVADIEPAKEWIVGNQGITADTEFHRGELSVEMLATLVSFSAMTMNAPGFMTIMSQSVGTPNVTVFGGYENSRSFSVGAKWAPYLGIDPINSCQCFMHHHACDKRINVPQALDNLRTFANEAVAKASTREARAPTGSENRTRDPIHQFG